MMDVISIINESLQILYTYIPKDLVIIIMAGLVMGFILKRDDKNSAKENN